jgi:hypothetical protein
MAVAHARRGIRSGSKLIESLDMVQGALESTGDSLHAGATALAAATAIDDVVYLKYFRLTWVDPQLGEDRLKARPERFELLLGVPHLADLEVAV